ncbi:MAG: DNA gyrase inhibitor YacG [Beijerinckiaceae bacterium]
MTDNPDENGREAATAGPDNPETTPERWPGRPCPVCRKLPDAKYRPFCSRHCADVDLARWLGGRYAIPAQPVAEDEED